MTTFRVLSLLVLSKLLMACSPGLHLTAKDPEEKPLRQGKVTITTSAKALVDLPVCNQTAAGVQSFVRDEDRFLHCDGQSWRSMTPGDQSGRFAARDPVRYYEWEDLETRRRWWSPLEKPVASADAGKSCREGWQLPSVDELKEAKTHGLFEGIKSRGGRYFAKAWSNDFEKGARIAVPLKDNEAMDASEEAGIYCVSFSGRS